MHKLLALFLLAGSLFGASFVGTGGLIPDGDVMTTDIVVPDLFTVSGVQVTLTDLTHTFVGDLSVQLTHIPSGITLDLFRFIGEDATTGRCADSTAPPGTCFEDLGGTYVFSSLGVLTLDAAARLAAPLGPVPPGTYLPATGNGVATSFSVFNGVSSQGTWRLTITDHELEDTGSFTSWTLDLAAAQATPEPATLSLVALGIGAVLFVRRRVA